MCYIRHAIVSVYDKRGLIPFARELARRDITLYTSGGTYAFLDKEHIPVCRIEEYTGFPEMMGGRVKTLHPLIHGGILARRDRSADLEAVKKHGIVLFDLVVVNLYPFRDAVNKKLSREEILENIDIGGPALVRAAAKNHQHVVVVTSPDDYARVLEEIENHNGSVSERLRRELAYKAYAHTAAYDAAIAEWLSREDIGDVSDEYLPPFLMLDFVRKEILRYGENPHQKAALYLDANAPSGTLAHSRQMGGKELSFNNYLDLEAARKVVFDFGEPCCAIIKHTNPCGVAVGDTLTEAYERALSCDPVSAFGSVVGFNRPVDVATAQVLSKLFIEAVIAPSFEEEAVAILRRKKNLRIVELGMPCHYPDRNWEFKKISGGLLLEEVDRRVVQELSLIHI